MKEKSLFLRAREIARDYLVLYYRWTRLDLFKEVLTQWYFEDDFKNGKTVSDEDLARCLLVDIVKLSMNMGYSLKADDNASMVVFVLYSEFYGDHWCRYSSFRRCARKSRFRERRNTKYCQLESEASKRPGTLLFFEILARFDQEDRVEFRKITEKYVQFLADNVDTDSGKVSKFRLRWSNYFNEGRDLTFKSYVPSFFKDRPGGRLVSTVSQEISDTERVTRSIETLGGIYLSKRFNDWLKSTKDS